MRLTVTTNGRTYTTFYSDGELAGAVSSVRTITEDFRNTMRIAFPSAFEDYVIEFRRVQRDMPMTERIPEPWRGYSGNGQDLRPAQPVDHFSSSYSATLNEFPLRSNDSDNVAGVTFGIGVGSANSSN